MYGVMVCCRVWLVTVHVVSEITLGVFILPGSFMSGTQENMSVRKNQERNLLSFQKF